MRLNRRLVLCLSGGILLQAASCATSIVPVVTSFIESTLIQSILQALLPP